MKQPASLPLYEVSVKPFRIPMRDGITLFATAWFPEGSGPFPAVVMYDPYRSSDFRTMARGKLFRYIARHGYVMLHLDVRGTDASGGIVTDEYLPQEQEDGFDAIEWLAAQPWCNGNVGMWGTSYAGFTSIQVAMHRPPHLKAIVPIYATDDRYTDDVHFVGGALHAICDLPTYATAMVCMNALPPHESVGAEFSKIWQAHLEGNEPYQFAWLAHQTDGPYWRHASLRPNYERLSCAMYLVGAWHDPYHNSALRAFQHCSCPKKLLVGPWGHVFPDWGVPGPSINFVDQMVRWFDQWLKGIDTGIMQEPPVTVYMQEYDLPSRQRRRTSGYWRSEPALPIPGFREMKLYLGSNGTLGVEVGRAGQDMFPYRATVGATNRTWADTPPIGPAIDQRPDELYSLVYTSNPLDESLEILGQPRVALTFASTAPVVNVVCKLCDAAPDGASALITWGVLNVTHRSSHANPQPLTPGESCQLEIELDATGWVFAQGHCIRLDISGSDWPNMWPSPYPAENTIRWGGQSGSCLTLPTVSAKPPEVLDLGESPLGVKGYVVGAAPPKFLVIHYPTSEQATFEVSASERGQLPGEGVEMAFDWHSSFTVSDRDPAHATLSADHRMSITRRGLKTMAHARSLLESTLDAFHLSIDLRVTVHDVERFTRHWMKSFPRHLV